MLTKPSLKKTIIGNLAISKRIEGLESNSIILVTGYGIIVGDLANPDNSDNLSPKDYISTLVGEIAKQYKEDYSIDTEELLPNNDGFITLENVKLLNSNGTTSRFQHLTVFFDQIIGVTIGSIDN